MAISLEASVPAAWDRAIVFACDGRYLPYALFAAEQIARGSIPGATSTSACARSARPLRCRLHWRRSGCGSVASSSGGALAGLPVDERRTEATYLRMLLPAALAGDYRRLLYLDSDVFVQGGDFGALLREESRNAGGGGGPGQLPVAQSAAARRTRSRR